MPDRLPRYYWDACVLLSFINGDPDRVDVIKQLLEEAASGKHELVTSTVSITEVAYGKSEQSGEPDAEGLQRIEDLWLPPSPIEMFEFHRLVARDARDLVRLRIDPGQKRLTPLDAIHLASAQRLQVNEFHTYDGDLLKRNGTMAFPIQHPWTPAPKIPGV